MAFVIKAEVRDASAKVFSFKAQKTMYGGKDIAVGDTVYVIASENEGGQGLIAKGIVTAADHSGVVKPEFPPLRSGGSVAAACRWPRSGGGGIRYTPRVSIDVKRTAKAKRPLGRDELRPYIGKPHIGRDGPRAELADRLYKQATDKIIAVSDAAAGWLEGWF